MVLQRLPRSRNIRILLGPPKLAVGTCLWVWLAEGPRLLPPSPPPRDRFCPASRQFRNGLDRYMTGVQLMGPPGSQCGIPSLGSEAGANQDPGTILPPCRGIFSRSLLGTGSNCWLLWHDGSGFHISLNRGLLSVRVGRAILPVLSPLGRARPGMTLQTHGFRPSGWCHPVDPLSSLPTKRSRYVATMEAVAPVELSPPTTDRVVISDTRGTMF